MKWLKKHAQVFNLDSNDIRVLTALEQPLSISELAENTHIPRTTLYTTVSQLQKRKFIKVFTLGKRKKWLTISERELSKLILSLNGNTPINNTFEQNTEFVIHTGLKNMTHLYETKIYADKFKHMYSVQPNTSVAGMIKKYPFQELVRVNTFIHEQKIIVETILQDTFLSFYTGLLQQSNKSPEDIRHIFSSYRQKMPNTSYISHTFLNLMSEIIIFHESLLLLNWQEETAIEITNSEIIYIFIKIFEYLKATGRKIDETPLTRQMFKKLA